MDSQKYFQQYDDYFWSLTSNVASAESAEYEIPFGGVIAYSEFVIEILEHLSEQSLPPFGSILLAIIATNHNASVNLDALYKYGKSKENLNGQSKANLFETEAVIDFLRLLEKLPPTYKTGSKRLLLFQTIFENCHNRVSKDKSKLYLDEYKVALKNQSIPFNKANFIKDFKTIALLKKKFVSVDSIIEAMENLPEQKIQFEEDELKQIQVYENPKDFVQQLIEESETFQVGSLIKRIWSGLNITLHHNTPSRQPLGGISDLTNKGDFEKLLISEFANDELIFMSRLANNEALYIQREIPPEEDKFKRIILIDSSLKNWGNPKIVNFATALAIAKHPKTDIECELYVLGERCEKVAIETIYDVIEGLSLLSGKLDCAEGLKSYFQYEESLNVENENFLILSEASLKSADIQKVIHDNFDKLKYLITTNESGEINICLIKNKGKKHIKTIQLSLAELWSKKMANHIDDIIVESKDLPILYPVVRSYKSFFRYKGEIFTVSRGILYQFAGVSKGFIKLAENIPFRDGEFIMIENGNKERILFNLIANKILSYNIETRIMAENKTLAVKKIGNVSLFSEGDNAYLNIDSTFFKISSDGQMKSVPDSLIYSWEEYHKEFLAIKKIFKHKRNNFNILYSLDDIWINKDRKYLDFNNYALQHNQLITKYFTDNDSFFRFEKYVDLIFKSTGKQPLAVVNLLKSCLNISLSEAKNIVDGNLKVILHDVTEKNAEDLKYQIEDLGGVCYTKIRKYVSPDGSIIMSQEGIAILKSSNKLIPTIYIPIVIKGMTALATRYEFSGNDYFLPKDNKMTVISVKDFFDKYIDPFINTILEHES